MSNFTLRNLQKPCNWIWTDSYYGFLWSLGTNCWQGKAKSTLKLFPVSDYCSMCSLICVFWHLCSSVSHCGFWIRFSMSWLLWWKYWIRTALKLKSIHHFWIFWVFVLWMNQQTEIRSGCSFESLDGLTKAERLIISTTEAGPRRAPAPLICASGY